METRANYAIVGLFTLMVLAASFGFVYWMTNYGSSGEVAQLNIRIPGSANGLSVGSPVRFNGISIGTVRGLTIDEDDPSFVLARTEVQAGAPVTESTEAVLEIQGLTGSAYIELGTGDVPGENILDRAALTGVPAELTADPSSVTNLLATADQILTRANSVVAEIEGFTQDARAPLTNTLRNTETFSQALTENAEGIDQFLESVASLSETFSGLSGRLDTTFEAAEQLLTSVDPEKVDSILGNVDLVTADLAAASGEVAETVASFRETAETFREFSGIARASLERVGSIVTTIDGLVAAVDGARIGETLDNIAVASADARSAIANAEAITESFGSRGEDIDQFITDVTQTANRLNAASVRVDGVVARVDAAIGESDVTNLLADVQSAVGSFTSVAQALDSAEIGQTLDNINAASADARSALANTEALTAGFGERAEDVDQFITDVTQTANRLNAASLRVDGMIARVDAAIGEGDVTNLLADVQSAVGSFTSVAQALDSAEIGQTLDNINAASVDARSALANTEALTAGFGERAEDVDQFITDVTEMANRLNAVSLRVDGVISKVDTALGEGDVSNLLADVQSAVNSFTSVAQAIDSTQIERAVDDIAAASASARDAVANTEEVTRQFGEREEDIDQFITNVTQMAERLNAASVRVDGVLAKVDGFLGEGDASNLLAEAEAAITSFREVADNINGRINPIAENLERFSNSGLRDVESLITETRRSIGRIERSISSIEDNPQRLLFGGEEVKQFDGRIRR